MEIGTTGETSWRGVHFWGRLANARLWGGRFWLWRRRLRRSVFRLFYMMIDVTHAAIVEVGKANTHSGLMLLRQPHSEWRLRRARPYGCFSQVLRECLGSASGSGYRLMIYFFSTLHNNTSSMSFILPFIVSNPVGSTLNSTALSSLARWDPTYYSLVFVHPHSPHTRPALGIPIETALQWLKWGIAACTNRVGTHPPRPCRQNLTPIRITLT